MWNLPKTRTVFQTKFSEFTVVLIPTTTGKAAYLAFLEVSRRLNAQQLEEVYQQSDDLSLEEIPQLITQLEAQMKEAAKNLEFEEAAKYRDRIKHLRDKLLGH
jgi:excinuclease ABC subunit B